jgi:hypothetical protein
LCRPEQPDDPSQQEEYPDEEPRRPAEITQPSRRREDRRELTRFQGAELDRRLFCRFSGSVSSEQVC